MNQFIQEILIDLYSLDPVFKQHEADVVRLVEALIKAKPDTKFDNQFAARLRASLLASAVPEKKRSIVNGFFSQFRKMMVTFVGSAAVVAVALLLLITTQRAERSLPPHTMSLPAAPAAEPLDAPAPAGPADGYEPSKPLQDENENAKMQYGAAGASVQDLSQQPVGGQTTNVTAPPVLMTTTNSPTSSASTSTAPTTSVYGAAAPR